MSTSLRDADRPLPEPDDLPFRARWRRRWHLAQRALLGRIVDHRRGDGIVVVSRGDLWPTDHGAAVKIVETARGLSRNDREVALVTDDRKRWWRVVNGHFEEQTYPAWLSLLNRPLPWVKWMHWSRDLPETDAFLYLPLSDGSYFRRLVWAASQVDAGVLHAEFPAYAAPCLAARAMLGCPVVLVEHNVEYQRMGEQVRDLTEAQRTRLRAIEVELARRSDAVVVVSEPDRQRLVADGVDRDRIALIPHGVDLESAEGPAEAGVRERFGIPAEAPLLAFHGTFSYPPNAQALKAFDAALLPQLEQRGVRAHVLAIGRNPPSRSPHERIHLVGPVDRVAPWLKAADLAVVPLTAGGGTRMKIIDCFAAGLPVVTTTKGIEGIPAEDGLTARIVDGWPDMADAIVTLLENPEAARILARGGHAYAASLDWSAIGKRYLDLYATL